MSRKVRWTVAGVRKRRHTIIAELALGRELRGSEEVHHVDENEENDDPSNLVICPSTEYHQLLHMRTRAWMACGNANWVKCKYCHIYDNPRNMTNKGKTSKAHKSCNSIKESERVK